MRKLRSDKSFKEFLRSERSPLFVGIILLLGLALILIGSLSDKAGDTEEAGGLEERVAEMCSMIDGAGECRVMITYTQDGEDVYAVAVLCEGGESGRVRSDVSELIGSLFGIGYNRISVLKISE